MQPEKLCPCRNQFNECFNVSIFSGNCPNVSSTGGILTRIPLQFTLFSSKSKPSDVQIAITAFLREIVDPKLPTVDIIEWNRVSPREIEMESCENHILDPGEEFVDCGGSCDNECQPICFYLNETTLEPFVSIPPTGQGKVSFQQVGVYGTRKLSLHSTFNLWLDASENLSQVETMAEICLNCTTAAAAASSYCERYNFFATDQKDGFQIYTERSNSGLALEKGQSCPFLSNATISLDVWNIRGSSSVELSLLESKFCLPYLKSSKVRTLEQQSIEDIDAISAEIVTILPTHLRENIVEILHQAQVGGVLQSFLATNFNIQTLVRKDHQLSMEKQICRSIDSNATDEWCDFTCHFESNLCAPNLCFCETNLPAVVGAFTQYNVIRDSIGIIGTALALFACICGILAVYTRKKDQKQVLKQRNSVKFSPDLTSILSESRVPLRVVHPHTALNADELSLMTGEILYGLRRETTMWYGEKLGTFGFFPATSVQETFNEKVELKTETAESREFNPPFIDSCVLTTAVLFLLSAVITFWYDSINNSFAFHPTGVYSIALGSVLCLWRFMKLQKQWYWGIVFCLASTFAFFSLPSVVPALLLIMTGVMQTVKSRHVNHLHSQQLDYRRLVLMGFAISLISIIPAFFWWKSIQTETNDCRHELEYNSTHAKPCIITQFNAWIIWPKSFGYSALCLSSFALFPVPRQLFLNLSIDQLHQQILVLLTIVSGLHILGHVINFGLSPDAVLQRFPTRSFVSGLGVFTALVALLSCKHFKGLNNSKEFNSKCTGSIVLYYLCLSVHSTTSIYWNLPPLVVFLLERGLRYRNQRTGQLQSMKQVDQYSAFLTIRCSPLFHVNPGSYIYIQPKSARDEWHPHFILSSVAVGDSIDLRLVLPVATGIKTTEAIETDGEFLIEGPYDESVYRDFYKHHNSKLIFTESNTAALASTLHCLLKAWSDQEPIQQLFIYWILDQSNIIRYKWLLEEIQVIETEIATRRRENRLSVEFQLELNIYVVNAVVVLDNQTPPPIRLRGLVLEAFKTTDMLEEMLNPRVNSDQQNLIQKLQNTPSNRLQDVWIWRGYPVVN